MQQATQHPIFIEYGERLGELARLLGYSEHSLLALKDGRRQPSSKFRAHAAAVLGKAETELFGGTTLCA